VGTDPTLPCIFLNSHYDVVPVIEVKLKTLCIDIMRAHYQLFS
jgi:hypothetical protein